MNPIRWLIEDFKKDIETIKGLITEPDSYSFDFGRVGPKMFALFVILALLSGAFISAKYYESKTNDIIINKCHTPLIPDKCITECIEQYDNSFPASQFDDVNLKFNFT